MFRRAIITAGRDDALGMASPLRFWREPPTSQRWMAALLLMFLLVVHIATEFDRFEHKRGNHNDHGDNLEVRHDLTSFNFRIQR